MSHDIRTALTGISGILVTPYDAGGAVAPARLGPVIDRAIGAGVDILVANGNTGEFYALDEAEAAAMCAAIVDRVDGRVPVFAGIGRGIAEAGRAARHARAAGADALMIHQTPDPFVAPRGYEEYVRRVVDAGDGLPAMLYLRNDAMGPDAIARLTGIAGVAGVKWATPNPMTLARAIAASDPSVIWVGGLAEVWAPPLCAVGAQGFTSGLINVWPERSVAIRDALRTGDFGEANRLIAGMRTFEDIRAEEMGGANVTGVKAALALIGQDCGAVRPPGAWPLSEGQGARLRAFLEANGF
ncbi:4-hydroxy-tetrahydrodipicolinate synthase [Rhodovulum iodosum]|uniref:4-hydroxy-tetrahydrodipicolinate synthase n=1 Tax=Rhodovulum iodosum TaxID=68291 RepID=A0ABV3XTW6_9RHOB|nr:dihydrodipicolinate synthase family protein [Rhodovulum robiginosum]RSK32214.1 dihydrodipicolinate synthase family protein [Rhodovulum robiginosum]